MTPDKKMAKEAAKEKNTNKEKFSLGRLLKSFWRGLCNLPKTIYQSAKTGLWDEDVYKRWFGTLIWGLLFFIVAWVVGYIFLKPQALSNTLLSMKLFGHQGSTALVTLKNFAQQLITILIFIVFFNHFRIGKLNASHYFFFIYSILVGLMVGTNSYSFYFHFSSKWQALLPFGVYGVWELIAYALILAATTKLAWFEIPGLFKGEWTRVRAFRDIKLSRDDIEVLIYGLLILLVSSFGEARQLVGRLGG